jgi:cell division transport system ATP-binding protein
MGEGANVIELQSVALRYGTGPEILHDVNLSLQRGDLRFLTGASGAGKSSLLRLLFLSLKPSRGSALLFGRNVSGLSARDLPQLRRRLGVVFQDFRLLDHLSVFENVALPLRAMGQRPVAYAHDVLDLLDWVGLKGRATDRPDTLSGGEKQRAAIARAVIARPQLLLADEPTGNVDPSLAQRLLRLFAELNKSGTSVVIATHDIALMDEYDARRLVLHDGRLHTYD